MMDFNSLINRSEIASALILIAAGVWFLVYRKEASKKKAKR